MIETDVCIVGAGPTGLCASLLLSQFSIDHILVEKRSQAQQAPAAHVINRRTMEIFRQIGLPMDVIYQLDKHGPDPLTIRWGSGLTGTTLGKITTDSGKKNNSNTNYSQEHLANISQPLLEETLRKLAQQSKHCTMKSAHTWLGFIDNPKNSIEYRQCSEIQGVDNERIQIKSSFVLAADGANSSIRQALNIKNLGSDDVASFLSLSCEVDKSKIENSSNTLIDWCLDPYLSGVVICHDPKKLSVYMRALHEPFESIADYDDEKCHELLTKLFGLNVSYKLLHKGTWQMTAQIAETFRVGGVFLVGDSAHRFPPTGGLGLNSGIADVHNLVWKIAASKNKQIPANLLASYETERKAVVQRNRDKSLANFKKMDDVIQAIGLDPSKAAIPARILNSPLIRHLPKQLKARIFELITFPVTKRLARANALTEEGEKIRSVIQLAINDQREHFDMPGLELGYVYRGGCALSNRALDTPDNTVLDYLPSTLPGCRFPHVALVENGTRKSTLDYLSYQRYTLLTNELLGNNPTFETFGLELSVVDASTLNVEKTDLEKTAIPLTKRLGIPVGGWILIRPDGHIADKSTNT